MIRAMTWFFFGLACISADSDLLFLENMAG